MIRLLPNSERKREKQNENIFSIFHTAFSSLSCRPSGTSCRHRKEEEKSKQKNVQAQCIWGEVYFFPDSRQRAFSNFPLFHSLSIHIFSLRIFHVGRCMNENFVVVLSVDSYIRSDMESGWIGFKDSHSVGENCIKFSVSQIE